MGWQSLSSIMGQMPEAVKVVGWATPGDTWRLGSFDDGTTAAWATSQRSRPVRPFEVRTFAGLTNQALLQCSAGLLIRLYRSGVARQPDGGRRWHARGDALVVPFTDVLSSARTTRTSDSRTGQADSAMRKAITRTSARMEGPSTPARRHRRASSSMAYSHDRPAVTRSGQGALVLASVPASAQTSLVSLTPQSSPATNPGCRSRSG